MIKSSGRAMLVLLVLLLISLRAGAEGEAKKDVLSLRVAPEQTITQNFLGFGAQGDFFLTLEFNRKRGVDERDLELIRRRVEAMRPRLIRTFFDYEWWEPEEGRQTPRSAHMRDYVEWVRFLQSIGCKVILNPWGDNFAYSAWMMPEYQKFPMDPKQSTLSRYPKLPVTIKAREAVARSLADLVKHLRVNEGLINIEYLCLMNEPDNDGRRPVDPAEYVATVKKLDQYLRERGVRKDLVLLGPDDCGSPPDGLSPFFRATAAPLANVTEAMASHTYVLKPDTLDLLSGWIQSRFKLEAEVRPAAPPRPLIIAEFGWLPGGLDPMKHPEVLEPYEYGLFLGHFAVAALRGGASAALMWDLLDTVYPSEGRGEFFSPWGLWHYKDRQWSPKPGFYAWSLMTRYCEPGSRVVGVRLEPEVKSPPVKSLDAVALISPAGKLTVLAANRADHPVRAGVASGLARTAMLREYVYDKSRVPTPNGEMIGASRVLRIERDKAGSLEIPARSLVVLSELD